MLELLKKQWILHVRENPIAYLLVVFIFITGIMTGTFTSIALSSQQKVNVGKFVVEFFNSNQSVPINRKAIFKESLLQHSIMAFFIWLLGLFVWGAPLSLLILGIRGFSFGFTIGFMIEHYRFGGFMFSLICIIPQSLIYVPCYIAMCITALLFSHTKLGEKGIRYTSEQKRNRVSAYTMKMIMSFSILLIGILFETFISPLFFPMFKWIFI